MGVLRAVQRMCGQEAGGGGCVLGCDMILRGVVARYGLPISGGGRASGSGRVSDGGRPDPDVG
jgi:hypothetical protein